MEMVSPKISVVIPCYNEEATIGKLLAALDAQTLPKSAFEVVIADGGSTDGTRVEIRRYLKDHPDLQVRVVDNPKRIIPAGLNTAIRDAKGSIITRMDAHTIPAKDYLDLSVQDLENAKGENVGGVIDIEPGKNTWIGRSIAAATAHPLGVGDARYRWTKVAGPVDTVAFGTFHRELFDRIGYYDETLLINEDYEFNTRIRLSGGGIWVNPAIRATYYSRPDLISLARQYFSYGFWKMKMLRRYPGSLRWRQALPPIFVLGVLMLLLGSAFFNIARILLPAGLGIYLFILIAGSIPVSIKKRDWTLASGIPLAIITMHFSWGTGFLWSILHQLSRK